MCTCGCVEVLCIFVFFFFCLCFFFNDTATTEIYTLSLHDALPISMDQLREGINLRAYGQKNPLLEYKSEGFKMFQEMMADMNSVTIQRLFRTQIQGLEQSPGIQERSVRNVQTSHQDTTGMGFQGKPQGQQANQPQQVRIPIQPGEKHGDRKSVV